MKLDLTIFELDHETEQIKYALRYRLVLCIHNRITLAINLYIISVLCNVLYDVIECR